MSQPEPTHELLKRNLPCCWSCGVPVGSSVEFVCPICGSTSWGWLNAGLRSTALSTIGLFVVGAISWEALLSFEILTSGRDLLLVLALVTFGASVYQLRTRNSGEDPSLPYSVCLGVFLLQMILLIVGVTQSWVFGLELAFVGLFWLDVSFYWKCSRPSIDKTLTAIGKRKQVLTLNQKRITQEIEKLEHAKKTSTLSEVERKLRQSRDLITREVEILQVDETYLANLRLFYRWKLTIYALVKGMPQLRSDDLDAFATLVDRLEAEIQRCSEAFGQEVHRGRAAAREVYDIITQSLFLHDRLREAFAARRAQQILSEVDLLSSMYDVPDQGTPLIIKDLDCTSEILSRVDAGYYKIQADADANESLRDK